MCRFVLENSGVAEPQNIRDLFNEGIAEGEQCLTPRVLELSLPCLYTMWPLPYKAEGSGALPQEILQPRS